METIKIGNGFLDRINITRDNSDITRLVFNEINNLNISNLYYEIDKNSKIGRHFEKPLLENEKSNQSLSQLIR